MTFAIVCDLPVPGGPSITKTVTLTGCDQASSLSCIGIEDAGQVFGRMSLVESALGFRLEADGFALVAARPFGQQPHHRMSDDPLPRWLGGPGR